MAHKEAKPTPPERPTTPPAEVLIVDNDEAHAEVVAEGLARVGFHCDVATSGTQGAQMIEEAEYDVVITDLVMSDIDGLGVLARAKKDLPEAEVILMTGHGTVPSAVTAMQQGAFNYLLKPLDLGQLRAIAEKAAAERSMPRTSKGQWMPPVPKTSSTMTSMANVTVSPKIIPPSSLPANRAGRRTGASSSRSSEPMRRSNTMTMASIEVVPNRRVNASNPGTSPRKSPGLRIAKARMKAIGNRMPQLMLGGLK